MKKIAINKLSKRKEMGKRKLLLKYLCNKRRFGSGKVSFIAARIEATLTLRSVPNSCAKFQQWRVKFHGK